METNHEFHQGNRRRRPGRRVDVGLRADITGAGATFPFPIYAKWADAYKKETGIGLNYQSIGSGAGIKQILAKTVTFGATDMPLKPEQLEKEGLVQWPQAMGALVPVVNLDGIKQGELVFSGELLGDIYLGKIKTWNDPAIAKLNPKLKLPSDAITVVRRSDGSGTTFVWTDYLSKVNAEWKSKVGVRHGGRMAGGRWRQGQRRRRRQCQPDQEFDRLCRIRLRQAEQADLRAVINKAGKSCSRPLRRSRPPPPTPTGPGSRTIRHPDRPAGRSLLADHRRDLHPDAQGAATDKAAAKEAHQVLHLGLREGRQDGRGARLHPDARHVVKLIEQTWATDIKS